MITVSSILVTLKLIKIVFFVCEGRDTSSRVLPSSWFGTPRWLLVMLSDTSTPRWFLVMLSETIYDIRD